MSFSSEIKNFLCSVNIKPLCCRKSLVYGMLFSQSDFENGIFRFTTDNEKCAQLLQHMVKSVFGVNFTYEIYDKLSRNKSLVQVYRAQFTDDLCQKMTKEFSSDTVLKCGNCAPHFVRGIFIAGGTITDPVKEYHLEFAISDDKKNIFVEQLLSDEGFEVKRTVRRGVSSLYIKKSEIIEDILTYIGASTYSIKIMDMKIVREIRNNENRKSNCDTANIYKSTGAAAVIIKVINKLIDDGKIDGLDQQLKVTADLRLKYPEMSLSELAGVHEPPITKSGLSHRLAKISAYYDKCYKNSEK